MLLAVRCIGLFYIARRLWTLSDPVLYKSFTAEFIDMAACAPKSYAYSYLNFAKRFFKADAAHFIITIIFVCLFSLYQLYILANLRLLSTAKRIFILKGASFAGSYINKKYCRKQRHTDWQVDTLEHTETCKQLARQTMDRTIDRMGLIICLNDLCF